MDALSQYPILTLILVFGWLAALLMLWRNRQGQIIATLAAVGLGILLVAWSYREEAKAIVGTNQTLPSAEKLERLKALVENIPLLIMAGSILIIIGLYAMAERSPSPTPRQSALRHLEQLYEAGQIDRATFEAETKKLFQPPMP